MKKKSLTLDKEVVLKQEELDGGWFIPFIRAIFTNLISDQINDPSGAFPCGYSNGGTCTPSCNPGNCGASLNCPA